MDIRITEQNNGGDMTLNNNDIAVVYGVENMPYLSMFGGPDFWGNDLLLQEKFRAFLATTEQTMLSVALNSQGRATIEEAARQDLQFLLEIVPNSTLTVQTRITDDNRLEMLITFNGQEINLLWNPQTATLTDTSNITPVCPVPLGLTLTELSSTSINATWTGISGVTYQYTYNTDGSVPSGWTDTTGIGVTLTGLTAGSTVYFFVRTKCVGSFSEYQSDTITTAPAPPVTADLVLSVFSTYGVEATGVSVDKWNDLSGNMNHLYSGGNKPLLTDNIFGTKPAISMTNTPASLMATLGNLSGLSGQPKCTVYIVANNPFPSGTFPFVTYSSTPGSIIQGEFESYLQGPAMTSEISTLAMGDVGFNTGLLPTTEDTPYVYAILVDFSEVATLEVRMYQNDSDAGFIKPVSNENGNNFIAAPFQIGAGDFNFGCVLVYSANHDALTRASIYNYLSTYFSI
jgi:hypothetical protein